MSVFLSNVKGFTPVIDVLAQQTSLTTAAVYGVAWRYCQMENRVCHASLETIAHHVGVNRKTVQRHMKQLCVLGYLEDTTPERKSAPHVYRDTGKAKIIGLLEAQVDGRTQSPTGSDIESYRGRTQSPTKKEEKKGIKKESAAQEPAAPPTKPKPPTPAQAMFSSLAVVCRIDLKLLSTTQRRQLNQTGKKLREEGITADDVQEFGKWWFANDWRGQENSPPRPHQVREEWGKFNWSRNGRNTARPADPKRPPRQTQTRDGQRQHGRSAGPDDEVQLRRRTCAH
jgi:hypothetical protein